MALPNPWAIDSEAVHRGSTLRVLAHAATEGQQGVLLADACKVTALQSPGASVLVAPGPYVILAKHQGGAYESYIGKIPAAEQVSISPVGSGGARTDLVYLRVENPYVPESTSWAQPSDPINGPYVYPRVQENVAADITNVASYNNTWSAIPLARITRAANSSTVQQSDITDLRSTASLRETRIIDNTPPPSTPTQPTPPAPPAGQPAPAPLIAFDIFTRPIICTQADEHASSQTSYHDFPNQAQWQVPVPAWATAADVTCWLTPQIQNGQVYGDMRFNLDGLVTSAVTYDENPTGWVRPVVLVTGKIDIPETKRGKVLKGKIETRSLASSGHPGKLIANLGCVATIIINFRRISV